MAGTTLPSPRGVLVTDGGRRLGAAICEAFACAGWHVWCQYRASGEAARALCGRLRAEGFEASAFEPDTGLDFSAEAAMRQLGVNLIAPMDVARLLARQAVDRNDGLDRSALHVFDQKVYNLSPDYFFYTQSKLALERAVPLQAQAPGVRMCGVAYACVFLAGTPSATSTTLCVDNGQHLVPLERDIMFVVNELLNNDIHDSKKASPP